MVKPLATLINVHIQQLIDLKAKPLGAFGKFKSLTVQLVQILSPRQTQLQLTHLAITLPALFIIAGVSQCLRGEGA
ncbi:hypothetical protein HUZ36_03015 [Pseudoalteromonas sp. McH1-7]|uniref:hypothetical protein n=1 Tax=Pseudoalteromonas TaxID=53246 RepID=UPI000FFF0726|nr:MULTISPECIES: hypothetical protein [Pseudoalteromonas]MDW7547572.1 hypothetical protein [Pseudoalteromonas peptidolytica]NUZ09746.1 hypothetical protein [Pseudoalteromonas sp. McH1-7]RXF00583.1 hypothetical protein D9603_14945 [Pseudoalteromonas sp. PS5]USD27795.1 hypothetical protein J8Z24_12720 [Pseudoalteromonas sp. SCSIO 43201]